MTNTPFRAILLLVALIIGGYVARHAFTEGMHTVIASQPPAQKAESSTIATMEGCQLDSHLQYVNLLRCRIEMRAAGDGNPLVFHSKPPPTMTKAESETASSWFLLAMFAIPLSLGAAALFGFLILHAVRTE